MAQDWHAILTRCGVGAPDVLKWAPVFAAEIGPTTFSTGWPEVPVFLGQILHESGMLTRLVENLNYTTAARIRAVWPSRFPTDADALPFVRNPQALANKVYGGRMGNVDPDDGWRYRGRGLIGVTGRGNYVAVGRVLGLPLEKDPDLLARPDIALRSAVAWWEGNVPDSILGDLVRVTRRVNGGTTGLDHRLAMTAKAKAAMG